MIVTGQRLKTRYANAAQQRNNEQSECVYGVPVRIGLALAGMLFLTPSSTNCIPNNAKRYPQAILRAAHTNPSSFFARLRNVVST